MVSIFRILRKFGEVHQPFFHRARSGCRGGLTDTAKEIEGLIADVDTTVMCRIQKTDPSIKKFSDKNFIKKNVTNSLYGLQKFHPSLS